MSFFIEEVFRQPADFIGRVRMAERLVEKHGEVRITTFARSILSRPLDAYFIGSGKRYIAVFAAHHALESITVNIAYIMIDYLLTKMSGGKINGVDCKLLLSKYCYIIVPCVNPDGIELRFHGVESSPLHDRQMRMSDGDFTDWQSNSRGVDLNHNYNFKFEEYKALELERGILPGRALFSGEYPESEPETHGVANLIRTVSPSAVVSLHSQGEEIYHFPDTRRVERIAKKLSVMTGYVLANPDGTAAYGGLCDYTGAIGIPSFTFEVGKGKNPLPESDISDIFYRIHKSIAILPTLL